MLTVDYIRELTSPQGETQVIEEGTYQIADGVFRVDKVDKRTGARSAEITNLRARKRIALDLDKQEASVRDSRVLPPMKVVPGPQTISRGERVDLGTKEVGGIVLHGSQQSFVTRNAAGLEQRHVAEGWMLQGKTPVLLEIRSEVTPGGESMTVGSRMFRGRRSRGTSLTSRRASR